MILSEDFVSAEIDESKFERLDLIENRSKLPVVAASVETLTESFLIDTGSNAFGTLHPGVIQDIGASVIATNNAVATVQAHWRKSYIHVDSFRMGNSEYGKQLFSVSEFNTIGLGLLLHESFVLSMPQRTLMIGKPTKPVQPDQIDKSGLRLIVQDGSVVVFDVHPQGPAFESGLRKGDIIASLNGQEVDPSRLFFLRELLRSAVVETVEVKYERDGVQLSTEFLLR